jgi:hypothetical protein
MNVHQATCRDGPYEGATHAGHGTAGVVFVDKPGNRLVIYRLRGNTLALENTAQRWPSEEERFRVLPEWDVRGAPW